MSMKFIGKVVIALNVVLVGVWLSTFTVGEHETAMLKRFGKVNKDAQGEVQMYEAGLHFKLPIFDNVVRTDRRSTSFEIENSRFMTNEKKDLIIDGVVTYRIEEPLRYITSTNGGVRTTLEARVKRLFVDAMKTEIGKYQILEVSSGAVTHIEDRVSTNDKRVGIKIEGKRDQIIADIESSVKAKIIDEYGVEIIDFRFKSLSLPNEIADSIYNRMRSERTTVANRFRAEGQKRATDIRSNADYQVNKTIEEAKQESLAIRGGAVAEANKIYVDTYGKNMELFNFMKAMESYAESLNGKDNVIFLRTSMPYFDMLFNKDNIIN
ncbi:protease modulator HflC [Vibrio coralliirubri]|uniref:protease modulator HflC n=1 Tax=Vibrio coralliirubri TaxID=1516159 RepID=UPI002283FCD6|nr:protease modulator HflC [Vibrio coralliirubri]MCY9861162.1 protease modulator HflC [Vibrio coralliirubri]